MPFSQRLKNIVIQAQSKEELREKVLRWKECMELKGGLKVNIEKTKVMRSGKSGGEIVKTGRWPCAVCGNSHQRTSGTTTPLVNPSTAISALNGVCPYTFPTRTRSSAYNSSHGNPSFTPLVTISIITTKSSGLSTDPWWTPTFTSNSVLYPCLLCPHNCPCTLIHCHHCLD